MFAEDIHGYLPKVELLVTEANSLDELLRLNIGAFDREAAAIELIHTHKPGSVYPSRALEFRVTSATLAAVRNAISYFVPTSTLSSSTPSG